MRDRRDASHAVRGRHDHGERRRERMRCMCRWHLSIGERRDRMCRLSGWELLLGARDCTDKLQPRAIFGEQCAELRVVRRRQLPVGKWPDGVP